MRHLALIALVLFWVAACNRPGSTSPHTQKQHAGEPDSCAPPKGLEFLRTIPELRGVTLDIREQEFAELIEQRGLIARPERRADQATSYWISTPSGENVIVMFREGVCSGIQRMRPTPQGARETSTAEEQAVVEIARRAVAANDDWADAATFEPTREKNGWSVYAARQPAVPGGYRFIRINAQGEVVQYVRGR